MNTPNFSQLLQMFLSTFCSLVVFFKFVRVLISRSVCMSVFLLFCMRSVIAYFAPKRGAKYCDESACQLVVRSQALHISETTELHQIFVHVVHGPGSSCSGDVAICYVLLDLWITSCFDASCIFLSGEKITTETTSPIPTKFCSSRRRSLLYSLLPSCSLAVFYVIQSHCSTAVRTRTLL